MASKICENCGKTANNWSAPVTIKGKLYCGKCAQLIVDEGIKNIVLTTTGGIDGYKVINYIDIESVEVVIGTGMFSEISGNISDFFGERSTAFEEKLKTAKKLAFDKLKYNAFEKGGNAVIGIDIDYTEFSANRIGVIANGTIVLIKKE